ncbi:hypothetical protein NEOKW01_1216 [Nematocida sp. AWRm80]|nr:hypothetical protein NEOKW01_1216 [Nematocida sp. AWRm80]
MPQRTILYVLYLPYTLDEYNVGHLYTTCKVSLREAKKGTKVTIQDNSPLVHRTLKECQHTLKHIDFSKKVPGLFRALAPKGALTMTEESFNAFPICKTIYLSGALSEKKFNAHIDTMFFSGYKPAVDPFEDMPPTEKCEVLDLFHGAQLAENTDLTELKTPAGDPLYPPEWEKSAKNVITIFKRVQVDFHLPLIGKRYIGDIIDFMRNIFIQGHQEVVKYHPEWSNLTMEDVRKEEAKTQEELDKIFPIKN